MMHNLLRYYRSYGYGSIDADNIDGLLHKDQNRNSSAETAVTSAASSVSTIFEDSVYSEVQPCTPPGYDAMEQHHVLPPPPQKRNSTLADVRLSMISNFSAAYNTVNISLALTLMRSTHPPEDSPSIANCSSALIAGMIIGQLGGGLLGDWLGRHMAMAVTLTLQICAAFMSAWSDVFTPNCNIYTLLACWRFLLGVGCGGVYPLAATITAESASDAQEKAKSVALMFSFQGVGYLAVSLSAYLFLRLFGEESDLAWRCHLGFGSLPGLVLIGSRMYHGKKLESDGQHPCRGHDIEYGMDKMSKTTLSDDTNKLTNFNLQRKRRSQIRLPPTSLWQQIQSEPNLVRKLVGTAGCWFLFDILFYGNTLFQPVVLSAAFGDSSTTLDIIHDSICISLLALPGYFVSVAMVGRQSPKRIQLQGFLCMAGLYTALGFTFGNLQRLYSLSLYGLTFFFSNYGPNSTVSDHEVCESFYDSMCKSNAIDPATLLFKQTFMLPSMTFSRPCRSTLNGICAASGKFGALLGACIFLPLASMIGIAHVMILCAVVSIASAVLTLIFTEDVAAPDKEPDDDTEAVRISSVVHLSSLQDVESDTRKANRLPTTVSMPTFLDFTHE